MSGVRTSRSGVPLAEGEVDALAGKTYGLHREPLFRLGNGPAAPSLADAVQSRSLMRTARGPWPLSRRIIVFAQVKPGLEATYEAMDQQLTDSLGGRRAVRI